MHNLALAILLALAPCAAIGAETCRVIDGDTLRCGPHGAYERVRLIGVYAAERGEPGYLEQRAALERRLASGAVTIERRGRDRYGRTLGHVYVAGQRITQADIGAPLGRGRRR